MLKLSHQDVNMNHKSTDYLIICKYIVKIKIAFLKVLMIEEAILKEAAELPEKTIITNT
jgi:hydrogenase-4 membrane subunit HyfE